MPFRLTQNLVDGLGVTGVEGALSTHRLARSLAEVASGVFRIACEVTMQLLRDNKDSLMSVLDAFIHDPLVEWEDEKRKLVGLIVTAYRSYKLTARTPNRNGSLLGGIRTTIMFAPPSTCVV